MSTPYNDGKKETSHSTLHTLQKYPFTLMGGTLKTKLIRQKINSCRKIQLNYFSLRKKAQEIGHQNEQSSEIGFHLQPEQFHFRSFRWDSEVRGATLTVRASTVSRLRASVM